MSEEQKLPRWKKVKIEQPIDSFQQLPTIAVKRWEKISFISPIFAGGVKNEGHHADPVTPVRNSSVRGQLRFWWRAAIGCRMRSLEEMKKREDFLFGNAQKRALLEICVEKSTITLSEKKIDNTSNLFYGAFPLQPSYNDPIAPLHTANGSFDLIVRYQKNKLSSDEIKKINREIDIAIESWISFGGLGGRTRRGFGALTCDRITDVEKLFAKIKDFGIINITGISAIEVDKSYFKTVSNDNAHEFVISKLRDFRQGSGIGRNIGQQKNRPGRSRWPEPDEIRRLTGQAEPRHSIPLTKVHKFPRGQFGLPIIFHFKDNQDPSGMITLQPEKTERMASPLIIKPYKNNRCALALILRDDDRFHHNFELNGYQVRLQLNHNEAQELKPLQNRNDDVLKAFLTFFAEK